MGWVKRVPIAMHGVGGAGVEVVPTGAEERLERLTAACEEKQRKIGELKHNAKRLQKRICLLKAEAIDFECIISTLEKEVANLKSSISFSSPW